MKNRVLCMLAIITCIAILYSSEGLAIRGGGMGGHGGGSAGFHMAATRTMNAPIAMRTPLPRAFSQSAVTSMPATGAPALQPGNQNVVSPAYQQQWGGQQHRESGMTPGYAYYGGQYYAGQPFYGASAGPLVRYGAEGPEILAGPEQSQPVPVEAITNNYYIQQPSDQPPSGSQATDTGIAGVGGPSAEPQEGNTGYGLPPAELQGGTNYGWPSAQPQGNVADGLPAVGPQAATYTIKSKQGTLGTLTVQAPSEQLVHRPAIVINPEAMYE